MSGKPFVSVIAFKPVIIFLVIPRHIGAYYGFYDKYERLNELKSLGTSL